MKFNLKFFIFVSISITGLSVFAIVCNLVPFFFLSTFSLVNRFIVSSIAIEWNYKKKWKLNEAIEKGCFCETIFFLIANFKQTSSQWLWWSMLRIRYFPYFSLLIEQHKIFRSWTSLVSLSSPSSSHHYHLWSYGFDCERFFTTLQLFSVWFIIWFEILLEIQSFHQR